MEPILMEEGNNGKEEVLASKSNATSGMLRNTDIVVRDDTNLEAEACDHFSISNRNFSRVHYEKLLTRESEVELQLLLTATGSIPALEETVPVAKVLDYKILQLHAREYVARSSEQDPHSCFPFEIDKLTWDPPLPVPPKKFRRWDCNGCVSKLISSDRKVNVDPALSSDQSAINNMGTCTISFLVTSLVPLSVGANEGTCKLPPSSMNGSSSNKDMNCATTGGYYLQATPHAASPDSSDNEPLSTLIKSEKRRIVQEPERTKTQTELEKSKEIHEIMAATSGNNDLLESPAAGKISKVHGKKTRKVRSLAEIIGNRNLEPPRKESTPDNGMNKDLIPIKENQKSEVASISGLIKAKSKKKYKALEVVDETSYFNAWLKKRSKKIKGHDTCAKIKNQEGRNVTVSSSLGLSLDKPSIEESGEKELLIGTIVKKKRTKVPRKFVNGAATGGEIACTKICHKPLQLTGNREANSKKGLFKIKSQKRKIENSKAEFGAQKIRKKKQKIPEKISNDIPMDIVELLAKSLRDKHLTDDTDSNSNANANSNSNSREQLQNKPPNRMIMNFSRQRSAFNRTSEASALTVMPGPLHCQSSNYTENINLNTARIDPSYRNVKQFPNGSLIQQPDMVRCVDWDCTQLQLNANLVSQSELRRNEVIPATHLLQLMDPSTSSSPSLNLRGFASPYHQLSVPSYFQSLNQNPHKLFRPLPRLGVYGSQLQKEITSPTRNCGTQSGYRIGNGSIPIEGICVVNRNPADFTVVDENNEYMIDGREIKPITGAYYGNSDSVVYRSRGIGNKQGFSNSRLLYNGFVI